MAPIRTCTGCRERDQQAGLVRLVADPAGRLKLDASRRSPGRGAYLHVRRECSLEAVRKGTLARALRRKLQPIDGDELWSRILNGSNVIRTEKEV